MVNTEFKFKSKEEYYWREEADVKNNTVREIDLSDNRFLELICWMVRGWNDGDIKIVIQKAEQPSCFFVRNIRDITVYKNLMIITWMTKTRDKRLAGQSTKRNKIPSSEARQKGEKQK